MRSLSAPLAPALGPIALGALATLAAADTVTLQPGGSLQAAVAAAQPGDTICIPAGEYVDTGTLTIDKPLTLLGAGSDATTYEVVAASPFDAPLPILVTGLAAGEEVRVIGLSLDSSPAGLSLIPSGVVVVLDCAGPVVLADLRGSLSPGSPDFGPLPGVVQVRGSDQVAIAGCDLTGGGGWVGAVAQDGVACLYVEDSTVAIDDSTLRGGAGIGGAFSSGLAGDGAPALRAVSSFARIGRSRLLGGAGTSGFAFEPVQAGDGAPAIHASQSTIHVRGGPGNELAGGAGSLGQVFGQPDLGAGASAVVLASSTLSTTPDVVPVPGADGGGAVTAPAVLSALGSTWTPLAQRLATMRTTPIAATLGAASTSEISAEPLGIGLIGFSGKQMPALQLPGVVGTVVLDVTAFGTLPVLALDAAGEASLSSTLPTLPSMAGTSVVLQGLALNPSGLLSVSPPTAQGFLP